MDNKTNPIIKSSFLYIIGTIFGQGMTFVGTIIFTRMMSQNSYGTYSSYYSIVSILAVLVGCNLYVSLENAYIDFKDEVIEYRKSILGLSLITCSIIGAAALVCNLFFLRDISIYLTVFAVIHGYSFFLVNYRMKSDNMEFKYKNKMFMLVVPPTLQMLVAWLLVFLFKEHMLEARIAGSTLGVFICGAIGFISIIRFKGQFFVKKYWKYALKISVPSIPMSISYMVMQQCDNIMIMWLVNAEATAVYSVIYYVGYAITAVSQGSSAVFQAWLYKTIASNKWELIPIIQKWYLILMAMVETVILMFAPEIVKIISPKQYWNFEFVAPFVLGASVMISYGFHTAVSLYYKKTGILSICVVISAAVNVFLNFILIPHFGAIAACYTTFISYMLLYFLTQCLSSKLNNKLYRKVYFYVFLIYSSLVCLLFQNVYNSYLLRFSSFFAILVGFTCYCIFNKKQMLFIKENLK